MARFVRTRRSPERRGRFALLAAALAALVVVGTAAAASHRAAVAPSNNSLPTIAGTATAGSTLTANPGTWSGSTPISFQYQWRICDGNGGGCHDIAGATTQTYQLKAADAGNTVRLQVIASNADGSANAASVPSARIAAAGSGPTNTVAPTVTGSTNTGGTLTVNPGTWTGPTPITFAYRWMICGETGASCHDISGATSTTYVVKAGDAGNTIRAEVTARNPAGTTVATTAATAKLGTGTGTGAGTGSGNAACGSAAAASQVVPIVEVAAPVRLQVAQFSVTSPVRKSSTSFSARFRVTDTCGHPVSGALVDAAAVPYNQFTGRKNIATDNTGWATMSFQRLAGFPASSKQRLLTMFIRAHKAGDPVLAGVSTRRLISFRISG
jgi:hypothetical protein